MEDRQGRDRATAAETTRRRHASRVWFDIASRGESPQVLASTSGPASSAVF